MKKSVWNALAANLILCAVAATVNCNCKCGDKSSAVGTAPYRSPGQDPSGKGEAWRFAVSGDSRNCGDVVMPAIADGARKDGAQFYWHLGDLRAIYDFDEDMQQEARMAGKRLNILGYEDTAWDDFYQHQVAPFENIPFYLGIGNHETIRLKSRCEFVRRFKDLLDRTDLEAGRVPIAWSMASLKQPVRGAYDVDCRKKPDAPTCCKLEGDQGEHVPPRTYYRWVKNGVSFIYLDNASKDQFDADQMKWFEAINQEDANNPQIQTIVVGMHKALPWSVSCDHSMNESPEGIASGTKVYEDLLESQKKGKKIYILASHSHYYMQDVYNTNHWIKNHEVLPGWIVGTAGAQRYALPKGADLAKARTYVYGYLLGRVHSDGNIEFEFTELKTSDVPAEVQSHYSARFVSDTCFADNRDTKEPEEKQYCKERP